MISIEYSNLGELFEVETLQGIYPAEVIEKPFFDPNKKLTL